MPEDKEPIPKFAARIKAKYPEYKDVDDTTLVQKMVAKYPEYADRVDMGGTEPAKKKVPSVQDSGISSLFGNAFGAIKTSVSEAPSTSKKTTEFEDFLATHKPIDIEDDDPIGTMQKSVASKNNQLKNRLENLQPGDNPLAIVEEAKQTNKNLKAVNNYAISNSDDAKKIVTKLVNKNNPRPLTADLDNYSIEEIQKRVPNTATGKLAFERYADKRKADAVINEGGEVYAMAQRMYGGDVDERGLPLEGKVADAFLNNPSVIERASKDGEFRNKYLAAKNSFYRDFQKYAGKKVGEKIGQKLEDERMTGWLYANPGLKKTDKAVELLKKDGDWTDEDQQVYDQQLKPIIGFGAGENVIPTSDLVHSTASGIGEGFAGVESSLRDLTNKATGGFMDENGNGLFQNLGLMETNEHRAERMRGEESLKANVRGSNEFRRTVQSGGHFAGFTVPMILGEAAGIPAPAMMVMQFEGGNADRARQLFPKDAGKQNLYTLLGTTIDASLGQLLPTKKVANGVNNLLKNDVEGIIKRLSSKEIDESVAKKEIGDKISDVLLKVAKGNTETGLVVSAFGTAHNGLDAAFGKRDFSLENEAREFGENFKTNWLSSTFLSAAGAFGGKRPTELDGKVLMEHANNPEASLELIQKTAKTNEPLAKDMQSNLEHITAVNEWLKTRDNMSEPAKEKFLATSLKQKVAADKIASSPDKSLVKKEEKFSAIAEIEKERLLNPETTNTEHIEKLYPLLPAGSKELLTTDGAFDKTKIPSYLEFIAQQATGHDENWKPQEDGKVPSMSQIPESIVEIAKEKFEDKINASTEQATKEAEELVRPEESGVKVVMPEENKAPKIEPLVKTEIKNEATSTPEETTEGNQSVPSTQGSDAKGEPIKDSSTAGEEPPKPPTKEPSSTGIVVEHPSTELSHRGLQVVANEFSLPDVQTRNPKTDIELRQNARESIEKWKENNSYAKNIEGLIKKAEEGEILTDEQRVILESHLAALSKELRSMDKSSPEFDDRLSEIARLKEAGERTRSEAGAALRIPVGGTSHPITDYASAMTTMAEAASVDKLTEAQKQEVDGLVKEYEQKVKDAQDRVAEVEQKYAELQAAKSVAKTVSSTKRENKDFGQERKQIVEDIRDKLKKARQDTQATIIPYAKELFAIAPDVAKLVKSYAEQGIVELSKIVDSIHDILKDDIDGITKKDVNDLIAGEYNKKRPTKTEVQQSIRDIKDEAALLNKLEALLSGNEPTAENKKIERTQRIKDLREQIADIKNRRVAEDKEANAFQKEDVPDDVKKLRTVIKSNQEKAKKLQEKLAKGDYEEDAKQTSWVQDAELKRKYPDLYNKALDALDAKEKAQLDFDIAVLKAEKAKRSVAKKGIDLASAVIATTKAVKSGIDDSAVMMQNIVAMVAHPRSGAKALKEHALDAFSEKRFRRYLTELHNSPIWDLMQKSGLDITDPKSLNEQNKEEIFDNNLLNKDIKIRGKKYNIGKYATRPFERAFTSLGNAMRVNMFTRIAERMKAEGKTFETHPKEFKDLATVLNTQTGRGKLHTQIQRASKLVTSGIWSPRLMASRLNMLGISELMPLVGGNKGYYSALTPEMRKMALLDMAKFIGAGASLMMFAGANGAGIDDDPESPTFGTIQVGDKKYNVWGGFAPYIKTIWQGGTGSRNINGKDKDVNRGKIIGNFFRSRLTPAAGVTTDIITQQQYDGSPVTIKGEIKNIMAPLSITSMYEAIKKDGAMGILTDGLPSFIGVNVSDERDYNKKHK